MSNAQDQRQELPAPMYKFDYGHMIPIVKILMERGHLPTTKRKTYGFRGGAGAMTKCHLTFPLTDEDWAAVTERLIIPENIIWWPPVIRDQVNEVQIQGDRIIIDVEGEVPIEEWMARQDWSDLPADVAWVAPGAGGGKDTS